MKLGLVGVGGAGSRIVNQIREHERETGRNFSDGNVLVFDTVEYDHPPSAVPRDQCISIGDTHPDVGKAGVDGDVDLAAAATREEAHDIRRMLDFVSIHELDGVLLVAGLGGGTGGGVGPVLLEELVAAYDEPVYALGVLPGNYEDGLAALNAARSLRSVVPAADNTFLFDNDAWTSEGENADEAYARANREVAIRVTSLLGTGELESGEVAETAVDSSDVVRTLETGGVSSIGYASATIDARRDGFLGWLWDLLTGSGEELVIDPATVNELVRQAVTSRLTLPCDVASAERALIVLSGPSAKLSRRGFESARHWLEEETDTVEVRAGDEPIPGSSELTATVALSNVTDVPRIDAIQDRAVAYQKQLTR
jgi:cell division GTPase FtsZ